jgi:hypothetical protein
MGIPYQVAKGRDSVMPMMGLHIRADRSVDKAVAEADGNDHQDPEA